VAAPKSAMSSVYRRLDERLADGDIVILDGGIGSELQDVGYPENPKERPANFTGDMRRRAPTCWKPTPSR
jgi:hypothetical protein